MKLVKDFPEEVREDIINKWNEFVKAAEDVKIKPPDNPEFIAALKQIFAFSNFVAKSFIQEPIMLDGLIKSGDLQREYARDEYADRLKVLLSGAKDDALLSGNLRRFRRREMVRIAWRDLLCLADLNEIMADLSSFADACIDQTLFFLYQRLCSEYGVPTGADGSSQCLVVLALGKLGGRELNFSSDVDLIFAYPEAGETKGGEKTISNDEFFMLLCRRLLKIIGENTSDGILFRVDMRLRPYGENGPLVMNFDALEEYYQLQGREWERYAWIKARVAAGDRAAGTVLLDRLKPFVYRRFLDFGAFESLRDMKKKIALEVKRKGIKDNIKLGPGGIREIEFFGQAFQLIRGGVTPVLQERSILKVLTSLARENYITQEVCDELIEAYIFLRKTENRLQEFSDQQTHKLPSDPGQRNLLALSMGFTGRVTSWDLFAPSLEHCMERVHFHFSNLLVSNKPETYDKDTAKNLEAVWQDPADSKECIKALSTAGFDSPDEALRQLDFLRNDPATRALSREGRKLVDKLMPHVLEKVGLSERPALVLNRIIDLIKTIERRTCYVSLLLENPSALNHLVKLANASSWIVSFLAKHPVLLDELLDPRSLYSPPQRSDLEEEIHRRLALIPFHDLERRMEELCIFKQAKTLRVAAADITDVFPLMKVSDYLSDIAETVLNEVLELSWKYLIEKHGRPDCFLNGNKNGRGFTVIAYGKMGGIELGYGSDLDLVFLHSGSKGQINGQTRGGKQSIDNAQFFIRLGQRVVHILTAHTSAGVLYETDMRLRPSGSSGILVSHVEAFKDYQMHKAWTWEHQALVRARAVSGDVNVAKYFGQIRKDVLSQRRDETKLQEEVNSMRERMRRELLKPEPGIFDIKQGRGGIVDIEFLVQYLVLLKSCEHIELTKWTDNARILQTLAEAEIIGGDTAHFLTEAYLTYRSSVHRLNLRGRPAKVPEEKFHSLIEEVKNIRDIYMRGA